MQSMTIGIPAYNEASNIQHLLRALLTQQLVSSELVEIIVYSDGSTDNTVELASAIDDERIMIYASNERNGLSHALNKIFSHTTSDLLVILNADVLPKNIYFLEQVTQPLIADETIGLVGANVISAEPRTYIEKIISTSHSWKQKTYSLINHGDTIYLCHGRARVFSKALYSQITFPHDVPEDAYSYLVCKQLGFHFKYTAEAAVIFRCPQTLKDHYRQSFRYFSGKRNLESYFLPSEVNEAFRLPLSATLPSSLEYFLKHPIGMFLFVTLTGYNYCIHQVLHSWLFQPKWPVATSSKQVL